MGKTFTPTAAANAVIWNSSYSYEKLTDGSFIASSGRFSTKYGYQGATFDATVDLGGTFELGTLRFNVYKQDIKSCGNALTIKVYINGEWKTVVNCSDSAAIQSHMVSYGSGETDAWLEFDFDDVKAEKIQIIIPKSYGNNGSSDKNCITFYEIECSGTEFKGGVISTENNVKNATDGSCDTYLEVLNTSNYSFEIELDRPRGLKNLSIYEIIDAKNLVNGVLSTASDSTDIEIFTKGTWVKIYDNVSLDDGFTSFYMYEVECTKVRITFENTRLFDGESTLRSAKICEISCTATDETLDYTEMKASLDKFPTTDTSSKTYNKFRGYVLNLKAPQAELDAYTAEIDRYCKMLEEVVFTPKTSITLSNALIYNVYVPVCTALKSFTLDGTKYTDLSTITDIATIGDADYYHFAIELPSPTAARDIVLVATLTVNGEDLSGSFTMSVPKYAKNVLTNGTAIEKQLVRDVLTYVKEAYSYFTEFNGTEEIERVNALVESLIGEYQAVSIARGTTQGDAKGLVTSVTLNLDAKPTIRFYVTDTSVEFLSDGKKLNTVIGTDKDYGAYVELDVYAYALCETITYGDGGSYHVSSFVDGSIGTKYEALVKAFVKYTESAADYRTAVIESNK